MIGLWMGIELFTQRPGNRERNKEHKLVSSKNNLWLHTQAEVSKDTNIWVRSIQILSRHVPIGSPWSGVLSQFMVGLFRLLQITRSSNIEREVLRSSQLMVSSL